MTVPTQQKPMILTQWAQFLFDSGICRGRHERGKHLIEQLKAMSDDISDLCANPSRDLVSAVNDLDTNLKKLIAAGEVVNQQTRDQSDQLLTAASSARDRETVERSQFTARAIADTIVSVAGGME